MNFISIFGLLAILLMSWAMSYHRKKIQVRPIVFGLGLQFVLAMVILREDIYSYIGMVMLAVLLVIFFLREQSYLTVLQRHIGHGIGGVLVCLGLVGVGKMGIDLRFVAGLALLALLVNVYVTKKDHVTGYLSSVMVLSLVAFFYVGQITGRQLFDGFSDKVSAFLALSDHGASFLFGFQWFANGNEFFPGFGATFAFKVLPTIIFFGGFMSVLYYLGVVQKVIIGMSRFMRWTMGTSGAESLSCSANIFVGQTEAPLLIRPYVDGMTRSELLTIMVGGFATIAGGVLAGYIAFGVDAGHLIAASVMSAPAALVISKIIYPELEASQTAGDVSMPEIPVGDNVLEAAASGISDGFKLALNVGAMLISFIALIAVLDVVLNWMDSVIDGQLLGGTYVEYGFAGSTPVKGEYQGFFPGSLQNLFGNLLKPLAILMGVPSEDASMVGNLLGMKLSLNEFVAFGTLGQYINEGLIGPRGAMIATYSLCGFANFSSIGIQIGGISALAPERRKDLAAVAFKAMLGGAFASWTTACVAGLLA